jgi:tetratricopeptide (TPR) repeat protein
LKKSVRNKDPRGLRHVHWFVVTAMFALVPPALGDQPPEAKVEMLLKVGLALAEKTHYLEALDPLSEAADLLEEAGKQNTRAYGDALFGLAQTKTRGRLHQGFPAAYVKSALREVQTANKLRERLQDIPPQQMAQGYYLEGFIYKKFFLRNEKALSCFRKAVNVDPGFAAAKRELSELISEKEPK